MKISWPPNFHHGLTRVATNNILLNLRDHGHNELPKDLRALFNTPRNVLLKQKCGCAFFYFGLNTSIK